MSERNDQDHGEDTPRDVVRPYVVDGIEEYDNPMPSWWVMMFNATIVFGFVYIIWVHLFGWSTLDSELKRDQQLHADMKKTLAEKSGQATRDLSELVKDEKVLASGKEIYQTNCAPCHGASGEGTVGPNLTDKFWLHGGKPEQIVGVITKGVPEKGMVAWGGILGPSKIESVAVYILSLKGTHPENPKAPQGEEMKE